MSVSHVAVVLCQSSDWHAAGLDTWHDTTVGVTHLCSVLGLLLAVSGCFCNATLRLQQHCLSVLHMRNGRLHGDHFTLSAPAIFWSIAPKNGLSLSSWLTLPVACRTIAVRPACTPR